MFGYTRAMLCCPSLLRTALPIECDITGGTEARWRNRPKSLVPPSGGPMLALPRPNPLISTGPCRSRQANRVNPIVMTTTGAQGNVLGQERLMMTQKLLILVQTKRWPWPVYQSLSTDDDAISSPPTFFPGRCRCLRRKSRHLRAALATFAAVRRRTSSLGRAPSSSSFSPAP